MTTPGLEMPSPARTAGSDLEGPLDAARVLARVGGSAALLGELIELFLEDCPGWLQDIRAHLDRGDLASLGQVAHLLRGSVGNFGTTPAYDAARRLELLARAGDRAGTEAAWRTLEVVLGRFQFDIAGLPRRDQTQAPHPRA